MNWYEWLAWSIALLTGLYSAIRWILEDRHRKATRAKWEIRHFENDAYVLKTLLPYTAKNVTLSAETSFPLAIENENFKPRSEKRFLPALRWGYGTGNEFLITWYRPLWPIPQTEVLLLPPKPPRIRK